VRNLAVELHILAFVTNDYMKLLIAGIKGGSNKTTLSINIAAELSATSSVLILDTDRQLSSHRWCINRTILPKIDSRAISSQLDAVVRQEAKNYDNVIIDGSVRLFDQPQLPTADLMLLPFQISAFSLSTLKIMSDIVKQYSIPALAVLSNVPTNAGNAAVVECKDFIKNYTKDSLKICNTVIYNRKWYIESAAIGQGVTEMSTSKDKSLKNAQAEIRNLLEEIKNYGY